MFMNLLITALSHMHARKYTPAASWVCECVGSVW